MYNPITIVCVTLVSKGGFIVFFRSTVYAGVRGVVITHLMTERMDFLSSSLGRQTCKLLLTWLRLEAQLHRQQQLRRPSRIVLSAGSRGSARVGAGLTGGSARSGLGSCEEARGLRCGPASTAWKVPRHSRSNTTRLLCSRRDALPRCIMTT